MRGVGSNSPLAEMLSRGSRYRGKRSPVEDEHMLDVSEAIFMKMADLMHEKGRSVRGVFTKYSVPEVFPDRTVLELLSPGGFLEGLKEAGIRDLEEFEVSCLMRVLAKPELDNAIILNELVMIMENFGVLDNAEDDDGNEYISDTEQSMHESVNQTTDKPKEQPDGE